MSLIEYRIVVSANGLIPSIAQLVSNLAAGKLVGSHLGHASTICIYMSVVAVGVGDS